MRMLFGGLGLAVLCAACVSTNAAVLNPGVSYQKICPDGVQMFTSAERVPAPYQEVAILNSKGESSWTDENQMMRSQQRKAASLGANGIILGDTREPNAGTKIIGSLLGTGAERKGKAIAIFIPSDSVRVQRVCGTTPLALDRPYRNEDEIPAPTVTPFGLAPEPAPAPSPAPARRAPQMARMGRVGPPERHGFWFNGGLGYGSLGCDGCDGRFGGLSGGLALGGTLSPNVLLGVGTTGFYRNDGPLTEPVGTLDARLRVYPSATGGFYLTGGVGLGHWSDDYGDFGSLSESGVGFLGGVGLDIPIGGNLNLTPFWNAVWVRTDNANANLGQLGLSVAVHKREPRMVDRSSAPPVEATPPSGYYRVHEVRAPIDTLDSVPAPSAMPVDVAPVDTVPVGIVAEPPDAGRTALPVGTNYVGDVRLRVYYPIGCAAQHAIPTEFQVFF
jgi:hypothetical protein